MTPRPVCVLLPTYDHRYDSLALRGLVRLIAGGWPLELYNYGGCSNIQRAREDALHFFLHRTAYREAVFIDSDTGFTLEDWERLLSGDEFGVAATCPRKVQPIAEHVAVEGELVTVTFRRPAEVEWGLGFARITRELLEAIGALTREDGTPIAREYLRDGELYREFCPMGAQVMDGHSVAEDHGFWTLAQLTGLPLRLERGCRLVHTGTAHWYGGEPDPLHPQGSDLTPR